MARKEDKNLVNDISTFRTELKKNGFDHELVLIDTAIISGFTVSEKIGEVMLVLNRFKTNKKVMEMFHNEVNDLCKRIKYLLT